MRFRADRTEAHGGQDLCRLTDCRKLEVVQGDWKNRWTHNGTYDVWNNYTRTSVLLNGRLSE